MKPYPSTRSAALAAWALGALLALAARPAEASQSRHHGTGANTSGAVSAHAGPAVVSAAATPPPASTRDTLAFTPIPADSDTLRVDWVKDEPADHDEQWWGHHHEDPSDMLLPRSPYGDGILTDRDQWRLGSKQFEEWPEPIGDYNRVDRLALGLGYQLHPSDPMAPRFGARWGYSFGREHSMYGVQLEQPLLRDGWLSLGGSMSRWTAHPDLQQTSDLENSLDLLFGRNDNRDYFEKEGFGAYLASRLGDVTTASVHMRNDEYRSLEAKGGITSIFWNSRELRANPAIDDGQAHTFSVRLERLSRRVVRPRAGFYHHLAYERSGGPTLKGDFDYGRLLGDVRGVMRLSPATTLALRMVGGSTLDGALPLQRAFTLGGFDGLRAHPTASRSGDQVALGQLEYDIDMWRLLPHDLLDGGLQLIAFLDAGQAWSNPSHAWDLGAQHVAVDGGFGLATEDGQFRLYFAHDLQQPDAPFIVSGRIERPF